MQNIEILDMSDLSNSTRDIEIQHPEYWTLQLALETKAVQYMLYDIDEENSLKVGEIPLDFTAGGYLKALENAIYDNPLLLNEYRSVRIMAHAQHFIVLPPEFEDPNDARSAFEAAFPDYEGDFTSCSLPRCKVNIGFEAPKGVVNFLERTFNMPPIVHHLYPLMEHYKHQDENRDVSCLHLHLKRETSDLVMTANRNGLVMANTYPTPTPQDTIYFALHAFKTFGLDAKRDELLLTGDKQLRDIVTPDLRKYVSYVMPAIMPAAALQIGQDAVKAPLELILLALCE